MFAQPPASYTSTDLLPHGFSAEFYIWHVLA